MLIGHEARRNGPSPPGWPRPGGRMRTAQKDHGQIAQDDEMRKRGPRPPRGEGTSISPATG